MKIYLAIALIAALSGAAVTKYYFPSEVTKTVEIEVVKNNIITEIREIIKSDGTKEIVTVVKDTSTKKSTDTAVVVAAPKPKWHASISATRSTDELLRSGATMVYGAQLDYAILGPISVGVRADSSKQVGVSIGVSF